MRESESKRWMAIGWRFLVWFALLIWLMLVGTACEHRDLTYYEAAEITINIDWSKAGLPAEEAAYGATALFYPAEGGKPKIVLMGNRASSKARMEVGHYRVVVFNRSFDDFGGIAFRGIDSYETAEAYLKDVVDRANASRVVTESPEALAIGRMADFEVTEEMLGNYGPLIVGKREVTGIAARSMLDLSPQPATQQVELKLDIPGLNNIRAAVCTIDALPQSLKLATGEFSEPAISQQFELGERSYESGSSTNGYMKGSFICFGLASEVPYTLHLKALLVDGKTIFEQTFESVTIEETPDGGGGTNVQIKTETPTDTVPEVKPEDGVEGGFDATVDDWGEEEESDIIL